MVFGFLLLTACGITGSSLGWFRQLPGMAGVMELTGECKIVGVYRGIRGDEFIAHGTPNAIAQAMHPTPLPRLNDRLGLGGRDFLVLHDSGAPVRHPAILARPATWGFFFLDLRRALAWYWWTPVFLGAIAFFLFFNTLCPGQQRLNLALSWSAVLVPCAAAWSFWPVNNAWGFFLAATIFLRTSGQRPLPQLAAAGIMAGWAIACAGLTLYAPRVIPIGTLAAVTTIAAGKRHHLWEPRRRWVFAAAIITVLLLTGLWFAAARDAIAAVQQSVYPGHRLVTGGEMPLWTLVRGWLAPLTVYRVGYLNQSEMQGALLLPLAFLVVFAAHYRAVRHDRIVWSIAGFTIWTLWYQHIGFPGWLAGITLWDRCTPARCDMALSLAQFLLIALLYRRCRDCPPERWITRPAGVVFWTLTAMLPLALLLSAPAELWIGLRAEWGRQLPIGLVVITIWYGICVFLMLSRFRRFCGFFAITAILPGVVFNPVCLAPRTVENRLQKLVEPAGDLPHNGRFLFATGNDFPAVAAFLAGARVLNGYFMYEDRQIFDTLFADLPDAEQLHRMYHLDARIAPPGTDLRAAPSYNDRIVLELPGDMDFARLPADFLVACETDRTVLTANPSLQWLTACDGWDYYRINPPQNRTQPMPR